MRMAIAACVFALVACGAPASRSEPIAEPAPQNAMFALDARAIVGRWSFDRSCGLYDLVFTADGAANYYDYGDELRVVSYAGRWARSDRNRLVLSLHRLGETGAPAGDALSYSFDVSAPVGDDLIGEFGPTGGPPRAVNAKRCPEEDRE